MFELQITQTRHPLHISDGKNVKVQHQPKKDFLSTMYKMEGAHLPCVNTHYAKFEYKEMKLLELQITQTRTHLPVSTFGQKNVKVQHPSKLRKYS